jgi:hypothetical protein
MRVWQVQFRMFREVLLTLDQASAPRMGGKEQA